MADSPKDSPVSSGAFEPQASVTRVMRIWKFLSRIKSSAVLFFAFGSTADILSTWLSRTTLKPQQGHEANFIVVAFVRWLGMPAGLVGSKVAAAVVVLASSVALARVFSQKVTDYRLAETLFFTMGCIYMAAGFWNVCGLALSGK